MDIMADADLNSANRLYNEEISKGANQPASNANFARCVELSQRAVQQYNTAADRSDNDNWVQRMAMAQDLLCLALHKEGWHKGALSATADATKFIKENQLPQGNQLGSSGHPDWWQKLGDLYNNQMHDANASEMPDLELASYNNAISAYERAANGASKRWEMALYHARFSYDLGQYAETAKTAQVALDNYTLVGNATPPARAELYCYLCLSQMQLKDFRDCLRSSEAAILFLRQGLASGQLGENPWRQNLDELLQNQGYAKRMLKNAAPAGRNHQPTFSISR
jgi:hypothetical protein